MKMHRIAVLAFLALWTPVAVAGSSSTNADALSQPVLLLLVLAVLSLAPFALMMLTSFVKIVVILSILRSAFGANQIPPNQIINGLAIVLTVYIMAPVGMDISGKLKQAELTQPEKMFSKQSLDSLVNAVNIGKEPLRSFLAEHSDTNETKLFISFLKSSESENIREFGNKDSFFVLIPAFVISQLKEAFQIGFLIFLPFIVIDMVVANVLQAMGMVMLSPTTISLPFKLLLFVLIDGWFLITKGLVSGYL